MSDVKVINRVSLGDIKGVAVFANRWFDSMNTYHSVYVSVLVSVDVANQLNANKHDRPAGEMVWIDLGENKFEAGYDNAYEQTAYKVFRECVNGNFIDFDNVRVSTLYTMCNMLQLTYDDEVQNVKRKKDL